MVAAHDGRESMLNRQEILTEGKTRSRPLDLADNMLVSLGALCPHDMHNVYAWPLYFISPLEFAHRPDDPKHGEYNRAAARYLPKLYGEDAGCVEPDGTISIDLPRIFKRQLMKKGVPEQNICLDHAYLSGELPHTRKGDGSGKYLAAAVRHF
jgi:hypothetical protein